MHNLSVKCYVNSIFSWLRLCFLIMKYLFGGISYQTCWYQHDAHISEGVQTLREVDHLKIDLPCQSIRWSEMHFESFLVARSKSHKEQVTLERLSFRRVLMSGIMWSITGKEFEISSKRTYIISVSVTFNYKYFFSLKHSFSHLICH